MLLKNGKGVFSLRLFGITNTFITLKFNMYSTKLNDYRVKNQTAGSLSLIGVRESIHIEMEMTRSC